MTWQLSKLDDVCHFIKNGKSIKQSKEVGGLPITRIETIANQTIDMSRVGYAGISAESTEGFLLQQGDILFSHINSLEHLGKTALYTGFPPELVHGMNLLNLRPDQSKVDCRYLLHVLRTRNTKTKLLRIANKSVNQASIAAGNLKKIEIPLPPILEQRRIAAILDKADALRAKRREAIAKLDQLKQAVFLEMFGDPVINSKGWPQIPFEELLENIDSGKSPVCLERPVVDGEWGVLKLGAVTRCTFDPAENKALPPGTAYDPNLEVKKGDLLFTRKNTYDLVAACAYVSETPSKLLLPDLIFRFRLKPDVPLYARYLQALLTHPGKRKSIQSLAGGAAGSMPNISKAKLKTVLIELPPQALQEQYEKAVKSIEAIRANQLVSLGKMDAAFMSLQQSLFQGNCAT